MKKIFLLILVAVSVAISFYSPAFSQSEKELFENGVSFLKQERYQEALDTFTELIAIAPGNPDAYKNRGVAHMKLDQYDLAIEDFERTKEIVPDLKGLYSNLGVAWYYKEDYPKAIENYNKEISLSPDNYFAYFNRAICRAELNEYGKSLGDINKTLKLFPEFYLALCLKGDLFAKMNQPQKAEQVYEEAILIDPDKAYAREQLAGLKMNDAKISKKTASLSEPVVTGNYELQAGAFQVRDNALRMQKKIENNGYKAKLLELKNSNNITLYLVRTGAYTNRNEAESAKTILKNNHGIDTIIMPFGRL